MDKFNQYIMKFIMKLVFVFLKMIGVDIFYEYKYNFFLLNSKKLNLLMYKVVN